MRDEMKRGRSQVIWRYTPGALFRYNESGGWSKTMRINMRESAPLTGALAVAVRDTLRRWKAIGPEGYPDPELQPKKFEVGEPLHVMYQAWPLVFTCRECGKVHYYRDVANLRSTNDRLACMRCKRNDQLKQIPYGYVCECGRLDTLFVPRCPHGDRHDVELINKGSFQESYWRCQVCRIPLRRSAREGLGYRRCECRPKKGKRGLPLEDSRTYYSQSVALVEVRPSLIQSWQGNQRFGDLLLAAVLQLDAYHPGDLTRLANWKPLSAELSPELIATRDLLIKGGMDPTQAEEIVRQGAREAGANPWVEYSRQLEPYRAALNVVWSDQQRTIEYVFVRDEPSVTTIPLEQLAAEAQASGDFASRERYEGEEALAAQLGLSRIAVVQALPILLAGVGYTRYFGSPRDVSDGDGSRPDAAPSPLALRPYVADSPQVPIYVARNTTEAFFFELDPYRVAAFLEVNLGVEVPTESTKSGPAIRSWLVQRAASLVMEGESHLVLEKWELEAGRIVDLPPALMFGVLHSVSHILKATAHRHVGVDADSLSEYLFPAHSAGLLYVSTHVEFTLGGIDSVVRSNLTQWLGSARDFAGRCSLDPVCSHSGGACLACMYPKFGCAHFNRTVSRAFLFGGEVRGLSAPLEGYWMPRVAAAAARLRLEASGLRSE
jgi:hypothetical protein